MRTRWTSWRCLVCGATTVDCNGGRRGRIIFKYVTGKVTITRRVGRLSTGPWSLGCKCTTPSIVFWGRFALPVLLSIKRRIRETSCIRDSCQNSNRWSCFHSSGEKKKEKEGLHTRTANATPPLRRQGSSWCYFLAVLYLLFVMYWWPLWVSLVGFLRSYVSLLLLIRSLLVQRIIECTLCWFRNGFSLYKLWFRLFRFFRFSPFAGEGFTCLDHSMLSKKKKLLPLIWVHVKEEIVIGEEELVQVTSKWI